MATAIILAGGESSRLRGDKVFMNISGRSVIGNQLEVLSPLFGEILIVANSERAAALRRFEGARTRVVEETVRGRGALGGLASGLELSSSERNFVLGCDMPFIRADAVSYVLEALDGFQAAVPETPGGLEPLHAAYDRDCLGPIMNRIEEGSLKVSSFFDDVRIRRIAWDEMSRFDPTGRMMFNINNPEDARLAGAVLVRGCPGVRVSGGPGAEELESRLEEALGGGVVGKGHGPGTDGEMRVLVTGGSGEEREGPAEVAVADARSMTRAERWLAEARLKEQTGASKVLLFDDLDGWERACVKVLDLARAWTGGAKMPEEIPEEVLEAVRDEAEDGKMTCEAAMALAGRLGVPREVVGRALDLMEIKIRECQLGCF